MLVKSIDQPSSKLAAAVNLFWFLSLVFSVSSGVSSLLGLMWRKSSMYVVFHACFGLTSSTQNCSYYTNKTPKLIRWWLKKAPILFLIIAAFTFIVGLNLFAFLSQQVRVKVNICFTRLTSFQQRRLVSITTVAATASHILGLVLVILWFVLESNQHNNVAKWMLHPYQQFKRDLELQREFWWYGPFYMHL